MALALKTIRTKQMTLSKLSPYAWKTWKVIDSR